jgi:rhodanese-related sulfurtransferase
MSDATSIKHIENERVIVTEWRFTPGASTGWHVHAHDYVIVPLMDGRLRLATKQGETTVEMRKGEPYYRSAGVEHDVINASDGDYAFMEVELKLSRLVGLPKCPILLDVRTDEDFEADPRLIPSAVRYPAIEVAEWAARLSGTNAIVICQKGLKLSQGTAAYLRHEGLSAETLEGGFEAWRQANLPVVPYARIPPRDQRGRTVWVTRARPKIDRIACPWLIRRFVDPHAVFLFVAPSEVTAVAERFGAVPFDIEGVLWSHRGDTCTFDTMVDEFGLDTESLRRLAAIVRGADK